MEKDPGQITATVGRVCLRFKNTVEAKGQVFVKCTFTGEGASMFVATQPATGGAQEAPGGDSTALLPPPTVLSEPVGITATVTAVSQPLEEGAAAATAAAAAAAVVDGQAVVDGDNVGDAVVATTAPAVKTSAAMDVGFSLDSSKFDLTEHNLSALENTTIKIELCMRGGGGPEDATADTIIGTASVTIAAVLRGENQWTTDLPLGTYTPPKANATNVTPEEETLRGARTGTELGESADQ